MRLKQIFLLTAISAVILSSCSKGKDPTPDPGNKTSADKTRDSIFLYAKEIYLWNDALPTEEVFNAKRFTTKSTNLLNYEDELNAIARYKINPSTSSPYEFPGSGTAAKYSYISDIADQNPTVFIPNKTSSVDLEGNGNDFGIRIIPYGNGNTPSNSDDFFLYISAVYPGSPAEKAGLKRSFRITKIDGVAIGANWTTDRAGIYNKLDGNKITLEGTKYVNDQPAGSFSETLNKAPYTSSPVLATNIFNSGSKKIGYMAYARFSKLSNSKPDIDKAFMNFRDNGITDLIIDLRYNGGGYVNTAEYLINQLAPVSSTFNEVMFSEHYNPLMQAGQAKILAEKPYLDANGKLQYNNGKIVTYANLDYSVEGNTKKFAASGALNNITNVVFIVMGGTASASELLINCLKPFMNVKMVGTQTYGKPVGFFPIRLENKYDVYYSLFQTKNSKGQGDYFNGFTPDVIDGLDDAAYDFGDEGENLIARAIGVLSAGIMRASSDKIMSIDGKSVNKAKLVPLPVIGGNEFVGMIETNHKIKK